MVVSIQPEPAFKVETPPLLFESSFDIGRADMRNWDISPDGQRFVMVQDDSEE